MNKRKLSIGAIASAIAVGAYYVVVGGGALGQTKAYNYMGECSILLSSKSPDEIRLFLEKIKNNENLIKYSDASAGTVAIMAGAKEVKNIGMGTPLKMCAEELQNRLDKMK